MASPNDHFPAVEEALLLPVEELGLCLLDFLRAMQEQFLNVGNSTGARYWQEYAGPKHEEFVVALSEAWAWLIREGIVVPRPGDHGGFMVFSRRAESIKSKPDLDAYRMARAFPAGCLEVVLESKVRPIFLRGDYDVAVFQAFKEVEVRVRDKAKLPAACLGADLVRTAFNPKSGPLTDAGLVDSEREAISHLFAGAIGAVKNPGSHRKVTMGAQEAVDLIHFANHLLRIVASRP
ncbi:MAG: hypothetical protein FD180_143 [Planctomycetota bacterium]|nr:MAG: hypothetical protein FD180_143 [Planctomycetota bacterium]